MMKTTLITCLLLGLCALPAAAGLKVTGQTDQSSYLPGDTGSVTLSVVADPGDNFSVISIGGPGASAPGLGYAGGAGAPQLTSTINQSEPPGSPFQPFFDATWVGKGFQSVPVGETPVPFAVFDFVVGAQGTYDFVITDMFFSDGTADPIGSFNGIVPGATVTAVPEPSSFLFLGLVGAGVGGVQYYRRRKNVADASEETEEEAV